MGELTEWFPRAITPVHIGVYEVRIKPNGKLSKWFSWWNGWYWCLSAQTPGEAEHWKGTRSDAAEHAGGFEWRGIVRSES
jgi:hypothetical protein